jgi:hypothetical protein
MTTTTISHRAREMAETIAHRAQPWLHRVHEDRRRALLFWGGIATVLVLFAVGILSKGRTGQDSSTEPPRAYASQ